MLTLFVLVVAVVVAAVISLLLLLLLVAFFFSFFFFFFLLAHFAAFGLDRVSRSVTNAQVISGDADLLCQARAISDGVA